MSVENDLDAIQLPFSAKKQDAVLGHLLFPVIKSKLIGF